MTEEIKQIDGKKQYKKIIIGFGIFLALSLSVFVIAVKYFSPKVPDVLPDGEKSAGNDSLILPASSDAADSEKTDTDKDGLTDVVEKMLKTNPFSKDTDDDGFNDFNELQEGYSPAISRPYDKYISEDFAKVKEDIKYINLDVYDKLFGKDGSSLLPEKSTTLAVMIPSVAPDLLFESAVLKEEISLSNKNWKYSFYAPANFDISKEQPLVIGLHGFGEEARSHIKFWQSDADKNGFLVAVLDNYFKTYPNGSVAESYPWNEIGDFIKAVLANIEKKYKIDENKIFLTGYSSGATAVYVATLDSGIKFRGVIPIDGYLPLEAGLIDKLNKAKDVNFYVAHRVDDIDAKEKASQEKILLQYGAKMEFKVLSGIAAGEYPAEEHENIVKWMKSLM